MNQTIRSTQMVTPFGSGYVHADYGPVPALQKHRKRSGARLAIVLTVTLFGAMTAAAISASNRSCSSVPKLWLQTPPSILKLPGAFGPDEMLF